MERPTPLIFSKPIAKLELVQDETQMHFAVLHCQMRLAKRVMLHLYINKEECKQWKQRLGRAIRFHRQFTLRKHLHHLRFFAKILQPEEHAMEVAFKQYLILLKIRVFRQLKRHYLRQMQLRDALAIGQQKLVQRKKLIVFRAIALYSSQSAIKTECLYKALQLRKRQLITRTFNSFKRFKVFMASVREISTKANEYHHRSILRRSLMGLRQFKHTQKYKFKLNHLSQQYRKANIEPVIMLNVFIAFQKYALDQKKKKGAARHYHTWLAKRTMCSLRQGLEIIKNYETQKVLSDEIYN